MPNCERACGQVALGKALTTERMFFNLSDAVKTYEKRRYECSTSAVSPSVQAHWGHLQSGLQVVLLPFEGNPLSGRSVPHV